MARTRQLVDLRTDARRLADLENATARFPDSEVTEYVNKGLMFVYRTLITVSDRPFFLKDYAFNTKAQVTLYPLPADYLRMVSVLWSTSPTGPWRELDPYEEPERSTLKNAGYLGSMYPSKYGVTGGSQAFTQGTIPTAYGIEILPPPTGGSTIVVRYVPTCPRLVNDTDTLDGILGFEDAATTWAAVLMRRKDDLPTDDLERDMQRHLMEIRTIARRRDSRPSRVRLTRTEDNYRQRRWRYGR